jgi:hypothetical protein
LLLDTNIVVGLWIAATALRFGLTLVTRDDHFTVIAGLSQVSWKVSFHGPRRTASSAWHPLSLLDGGDTEPLVGDQRYGRIGTVLCKPVPLIPSPS